MREDCDPETVKFRDRHGKLVTFKRIPPGCPKPRRRPSTRHLKPYQYRSKKHLGDASCSTSPRWVRGGVGFLLGTLLGSMIGGGLALAVTTTQFEITEPINAVSRVKTMAVVATGITVLGAAAGLTVGAWKPEC
jgi:hypothetical protein